MRARSSPSCGAHLRATARVERQPAHLHGERHVPLRLELARASNASDKYATPAIASTPAAADAASTPSWNFSQTRGTAKKIVGSAVARGLRPPSNQAAREPCLASGRRSSRSADTTLGDVAERQERQEAVAGARAERSR